MAKRLGLRGQSTLALLLACLIALIPALLIGWQAVDEVRRHFASAYAEQYTLLQMQRVIAPVSRELALSRRFAGSVVTREWLRTPEDPQRRARFLDEAEGYRQQFASNAYFVIDHATGDRYVGDGSPNGELAPQHRLSPEAPADSWYFDTMSSTSTYRISVNADPTLERAMIWVNVKVRDNGETLGLAGGGIDLGQFLNRFLRDSAPGLTPMIVDARGTLQAHPDRTYLDHPEAAHTPSATPSGQRLHAMVPTAQRDDVRKALHDAMRRPGHIVALDVELEGEPRLLSVGYIPELQWFLVTALDLQSAAVLDSRWLWPLVGGLGLLLALLTAAFAYATHRLILAPLGRLQLSAKAIAAGDYAPRLPTDRFDEIGALSRAFSDMADQVADHTQRLEEKVRQRTRDLEQANDEMRRARRQVDASLEYASIIQRAILPRGQLDHHLADRHAVVWRPRDQVGGDIYVFRADQQGFLVGVIDCAGHGVPGSLMTMLARAIVDHAILRAGPHDPAAILDEMDRQNRATLHRDTLPRSIATHMDAALVWVEPHRDRMTFAGAKLPLYTSDGERLEIYPAGKRALGHKRPEPFHNQTLTLRRGWTYTLCTDGFLDQAGGEHGFGFGNRRFEAMLIRHARAPMAAQATAFEAELDAYRGPHPQRDDITLVSFRFEPDDPHARPTAPPPAAT